MTTVYPSGLLEAGTQSANPSVTQGQGFREYVILGDGGVELASVAFWLAHPPIYPRGAGGHRANIADGHKDTCKE